MAFEILHFGHVTTETVLTVTNQCAFSINWRLTRTIAQSLAQRDFREQVQNIWQVAVVGQSLDYVFNRCLIALEVEIVRDDLLFQLTAFHLIVRHHFYLVVHEVSQIAEFTLLNLPYF